MQFFTIDLFNRHLQKTEAEACSPACLHIYLTNTSRSFPWFIRGFGGHLLGN